MPSAESALAVAVRALDYSHPRGGEKVPAFAGLRFELPAGELLGLAGVNGSGKSTLLLILAGIYPCPAGNIEIFGQGLNDAAKRVALLMQDADVQILGATPEEDLLLGQSGKKDAALRLAARLGLAEKLHCPAQSLSYGQKRKLCLASALLRGPDLLLLDEPFSGLDYPGIKELRSILRECKKSGMSIVVSTHDLEPVLEFTDKLLFLSPDGRSMFGPPAKMLENAAPMGIRPPLRRDFP